MQFKDYFSYSKTSARTNSTPLNFSAPHISMPSYDQIIQIKRSIAILILLGLGVILCLLLGSSLCFIKRIKQQRARHLREISLARQDVPVAMYNYRPIDLRRREK